MTTVSRTSQVTHSSVSGGGDWDHRLNRLLEDLQETVVPPESRGGGTEYKEYRMTSSSRSNDEPATTTDEKWVEYGTRGGHGSGVTRTPAAYSSLTPAGDSGYGPNSSSLLSSSSSKHFSEKTVGFSDTNGHGGPGTNRVYGIDPGLKHDYSSGRTQQTQMEFLNPVNTTTILKSGPTSPVSSSLVSSSPKVERKEFYAKASYTTLIKGGPDGEVITERSGSDRLLDDIIPRDRNFPSDFSSRPSILPATPTPTPSRPLQSSMTTSESRREFMSSRETRGAPLDPTPGPPLYSSTPVKTSSYSSTREVLNDRSVTPPPKPADGLKTPPLIRKMLQQSQQSSSYNKQSTSTYGSRPPPAASPPTPIPYYDEGEGPRQPSQYYTATTTRTETREREVTPVKRFPSPHPPREQYGEPPKRLDELLATFDESYTETSRISGDGGGPHKSHPYGPGTHQIRTVRIDDNVQSRNIVDTDNDLRQRSSSYKNPAYGDSMAVQKTQNQAGPPVYYPPGQIFSGEEAALMNAEAGEKGKAKMKMERQYKAKEKSKSSHSEKGGGGAVPVPVCLPVCCAAPCTIM